LESEEIEMSDDRDLSAKPSVLESVAIVFKLLDELTLARRQMGVSELARLLNESKVRIYRHISSMKQIGVVEQDPLTEKYRLGAKLMVYGNVASEQFDLRAMAEPYLTRVRDETGQTALLAVATGESTLVVAAVESTSDVVISVKPGTRPPVHCSAQGRVVLAFMDPEESARFLYRKLAPQTGQSLTDPNLIKERLKLIQGRLFEISVGEVMEGITALAAPIFRDQNRLAGSIGIIGGGRDVPDPPSQSALLAIQAAAAELSGRLGSDMYERVLGTRPRFGGK
jgi:IclR family transcriptional regulator, KDG regulon repressor